MSETWDVLLRDLSSHPSQFSAETIELFRRLPPEQRVVWLTHIPAYRRWRYVRDNVAGAAPDVKSFIRDRVRRPQ